MLHERSKVHRRHSTGNPTAMARLILRMMLTDLVAEEKARTHCISVANIQKLLELYRYNMLRAPQYDELRLAMEGLHRQLASTKSVEDFTNDSIRILVSIREESGGPDDPEARNLAIQLLQALAALLQVPNSPPP